MISILENTWVYLSILMPRYPVPDPKTQTIKMSESELRLLKEARAQLLDVGLRRLNSLEVNCPRCVSNLPGITVSTPRWKCEKCGYVQAGIQLGIEEGTVTLGAMSAIGTVSFLSWIRSLHAKGDR